MQPLCRLLPNIQADGPTQMAADDTLLDSATHGIASLRFYTWSVPTLSLGYFQQARPARDDPRLKELAWLRRPSGGAALVHQHELTYALALPAGTCWQPAGCSWLLRMHQCIQAALAEWNISVHLAEREQVFGPVLCFLHHTPGDLLLGACKVVGSAQRKQRGALLQHGGILLATSPYTPLLPGIRELSARALEPADLQAVLVATLSRQTGWAIEVGDWTDEEHQRQQTWRTRRYLSAAWNEKR
jgi:lipoate-protein ligase A